MKFHKHRQLNHMVEQRSNLFNKVINQKQFKLQNLESQYVKSEVKFEKENKYLEGYFWKQMLNYAKDLETKAAKIE